MAKSHLSDVTGNNKMKCVCKTKRGGKSKQKEEESGKKKKQIALVDPGSKRRKEGEGGGERERVGREDKPLQTDSETKLLYCWMLRLRMSEQGPRTRSKRGRSSFTHFRGPRATTVAARGRFISRAISPK